MAFVVAGLAAASPKPLQPDSIHGTVARALARQFPRDHLSHAPFDDAMSSRMWTNYLAALDYERVYFLASDITALRKHEFTLDDEMLDRNVQFAFDAFEVFRDRVRDRVQFVQRLLDQGLDLNASEVYRWQRKDAPWPETEAERDDLWRRRIKNEYLRLVLARSATNGASEGASAPAPPSNGQAGKDEGAPSPETSIRKRYQQFLTLLDDADADWVMERYFNAFTRAYDPHSEYLSPSSVEDFNIEMRLSLVGIGAVLTSEDGTAKIVRLIPGGPADRDKRLRPGDRIIEVAEGNGKPVDVLHWPLQKVVKLIRGKKGTRVVLTVIPASDPTGTTTRRIDLVRDEVKLEDQAASVKRREMKDEEGHTRKLGVIALPGFYADMQAMSRRANEFRSSTRDVEAILQALLSEGVDGVILDLRNNGGGSLMEAVTMSGLFIPSGPVVQVREVSGIRVWADTDTRLVYDGPLIVLVNRLSASASEILAAALQDYGRALVVGDSKTHGKGTVQSLVEVGRDRNLGSAKITTACYYRITGSSTQLRGVAPDIVLSSPFDVMDLGEEVLPHAIGWSQVDSARFTPLADLRPLASKLRAQSQRRLAGDPRYEAYGQLLDRIRSLNRMEEVPLDLASRRRLAQMEKELADLQERLSPEEDPDERKPDEDRPDLVLEEALRILVDWSRSVTDRGQALRGAPVSGPATLFRWLPSSI